MSDSAPSAGERPRLAFVYHPRSFGTMAIAEAAENSDHLVSPEEAIRIAMARQ